MHIRRVRKTHNTVFIRECDSWQWDGNWHSQLSMPNTPPRPPLYIQNNHSNNNGNRRGEEKKKATKFVWGRGRVKVRGRAAPARWIHAGMTAMLNQQLFTSHYSLTISPPLSLSDHVSKAQTGGVLTVVSQPCLPAAAKHALARSTN